MHKPASGAAPETDGRGIGQHDAQQAGVQGDELGVVHKVREACERVEREQNVHSIHLSGVGPDAWPRWHAHCLCHRLLRITKAFSAFWKPTDG